MPPKPRTQQDLLLEIADLRLRMAEAEDVLRAIRNYEVDALVVRAPEGDQVYAFNTAGDAYHQMVEQMSEGAATLTEDGIVLFANQKLAHLLDCPVQEIVGGPIARCLSPVEWERLAALIREPVGGRLTGHLQTRQGRRVPAAFSATRVRFDDKSVVLLLISDLTDEEQANRISRLLQLATRLSVAVTPAQVAEVVVNGAVQALHADRGFLAVPNPAQTHLQALHAVGYSAARRAAIAELPLQPGLPATDALLSRTLVTIENAAERLERYPNLPPPTPEGEHGALFAAPLVLPDRLMGVLQVSFAGARPFEPNDREYVLAVAQQCALALERAGLYSELEERVQVRTAELQAANERLAHANEQLVAEIAERREAQRLAERSREEERARVARELHDELGSTLTALKMDASRVLKDASLSDRARQQVVGMTGLVTHGIASVRRLATELRPQLLDDLGLLPALQFHFQDFLKRTGMSGEFVCQLEELSLSDETATACFRIVQEALTNITRHAQATQVTLQVEAAGETVVVRVADNGRGMDLSSSVAHGHFGLVGMRERANLLASPLEITSAPGQGTTVLLRIPRPPAETGG